ncbi:MAG: hypothetical protein U0T32_01205 [Chitinophagales bacterium]
MAKSVGIAVTDPSQIISNRNQILSRLNLYSLFISAYVAKEMLKPFVVCLMFLAIKKIDMKFVVQFINELGNKF